MDNDKLICYGFTFNIRAKSKNGKIYHAHRIAAIGLNYELGRWDMITTLKRRGMLLININSVTVDRIEFALNRQGEPLNLILSEYMPFIPHNLNAE